MSETSIIKKPQNRKLDKIEWELFCQLYASDQEFFANGTQSYIKAFKINTSRSGAYKSSQASSSRLLSNVIILERINVLLELRGLNAPFVDKQLEFLITQNADFGSKIRAIQEYNQLQQRINKVPLVDNRTVNIYTKEDINAGGESWVRNNVERVKEILESI